MISRALNVALAAAAAAALLACPPRQPEVKRETVPATDTGGAEAELDLPAGSATKACEVQAPSQPAWYHGAVAYEIFVRSFADSDGDGVGDFQGMRARLDYLNDGDPATGDDLGVDLLWLMPITESPSYHGYDTVDYRAVDSEYGTRADLKAFLHDAHARGIRVVMDLVLNHASLRHPWFIASSAGPDAERRSWFVWSDEPLDWKRPWDGGRTWHRHASGSYYYGLFWEGMPDLNFESEAVRDEMTAVALFWLAEGLDGFRLDAARYLVETGGGPGQSDTEQTHAYWQELRTAVAKGHPEALLVGEVWAPTEVMASYLGVGGSDELHMAFDFDLATTLVEGLRLGNATRVRQALCARLRGVPAEAGVGTFLTNHDMDRVATELRTCDPAALRLGAAVLLTLPGTPWLYYGEEIGLKNGRGQGDIRRRLPMRWDDTPHAGFSTSEPWSGPIDEGGPPSVAEQTGDPESLLSFYRELITFRRLSPALTLGSARLLDASSEGGRPLALLRAREGEEVVVVYSFSKVPEKVSVQDAALAGRFFEDLLSGDVVGAADAEGVLDLGEVEAYGFRILGPL